VKLRVTPLEKGKGFQYVNSAPVEQIPKDFWPAVESGVTSALSRGVVASYPIIDVKVEVFGGAFNEQDSDEVAFQIAASMAFIEACKSAHAVLLEPMMKAEIIVPSEYMGSVMGDVNSRRGNIKGMNQRGTNQVLDAEVPLAEMFGYVDSLRTLTQGRGSYTMQFGNYAQIPENVLKPLLLRIRGY
jgi:elongation factor G